MRVGFPWISLDSLVRIETFQWVTRHKAHKLFNSRFLPGVRSATTGARGRGHAEGQDCSRGKLNLVSVFLQKSVVRAVPLRPPEERKDEGSAHERIAESNEIVRRVTRLRLRPLLQTQRHLALWRECRG